MFRRGLRDSDIAISILTLDRARREKLIKIGAKVVSHGRYVVFQMAEVAIPRQMFQEILRLIAELRPQPPPAPASSVRLSRVQAQSTGGMRPDASENSQINPSTIVRAARAAGSQPYLPSGFQGRCKIATLQAGFGVIRGMSADYRKRWPHLEQHYDGTK